MFRSFKDNYNTYFKIVSYITFIKYYSDVAYSILLAILATYHEPPPPQILALSS